MNIEESLGEIPILVEGADGFRRYLDEEPIHAGDVLEFFDVRKSSWLKARYESVPGTRGRAAVLCFPDDTSIPIAETTRLRWLAR